MRVSRIARPSSISGATVRVAGPRGEHCNSAVSGTVENSPTSLKVSSAWEACGVSSGAALVNEPPPGWVARRPGRGGSFTGGNPIVGLARLDLPQPGAFGLFTFAEWGSRQCEAACPEPRERRGPPKVLLTPV
jgi:hypothetical protein